jgi:uncharacterized phiE125 gp8 family phage protein
MAFAEDLLQIRGAKKTPTLSLVQDSLVEPVTVEEVKDACKMRKNTSMDDQKIADLISACRRAIEQYTNRIYISQIWEQRNSLIEGSYQLFRYPILSVNSINYYSSWESDTLTLVPATSYIVSDKTVVTRSTWPAHRGFDSWITNFTCGLGLVTNANDQAQVAAARAAIPQNVKQAIFQYVGHLYENPNGTGVEIRYEEQQQQYGNLPANVGLLLEGSRRWTFGFRS